jgi:hypothetical protein
MSETSDDCPDCRHKQDESPGERTGLICMRLEPAMPARFMRRTSGMCGPAAKLFEPKHNQKGDAHGRRHER